MNIDDKLNYIFRKHDLDLPKYYLQEDERYISKSELAIAEIKELVRESGLTEAIEIMKEYRKATIGRVAMKPELEWKDWFVSLMRRNNEAIDEILKTWE